MTPEQINTLSKMLADTKTAINETEEMLADFNACTSEISKKYLAAAIKKHAASIVSHMQSLD